MPEKTTISRREKAFTLSDADQLCQVVRVHCHYCRTTRHYLPKDLITLLGDVPAYSMASRMRCDHCRRNEYVSAKCVFVSGPDIGTIRVRHLVEVKTVKVPIWREGNL